MGETSLTGEVRIYGDFVIEPDETVQLRLAATALVAGDTSANPFEDAVQFDPRASGRLTITNDDMQIAAVPRR